MAIFLGRELGERIKRLNVFNNALDAAPLGPSTSFHPSPPPQNFLCTLDASKLFSPGYFALFKASLPRAMNSSCVASKISETSFSGYNFDFYCKPFQDQEHPFYVPVFC